MSRKTERIMNKNKHTRRELCRVRRCERRDASQPTRSNRMLCSSTGHQLHQPKHLHLFLHEINPYRIHRHTRIKKNVNENNGSEWKKHQWKYTLKLLGCSEAVNTCRDVAEWQNTKIILKFNLINEFFCFFGFFFLCSEDFFCIRRRRRRHRRHRRRFFCHHVKANTNERTRQTDFFYISFALRF